MDTETWFCSKFREDLKKPVLMVGAGGIGCELIKGLGLSGFKNVHVIDLDTIDVSNLNRQFLFRKEHVGKSKAEVASNAILQKFPDMNIKWHHASVFDPEFGADYIATFAVVFNALDNARARNHVNRLCIAKSIPLIDAGTSGYLGQCKPILPTMSQCYECTPQLRDENRTYPGCTIRNTPSEPIHCIVWAKFLFNQLFSEVDAHEEISPNEKDPEAEENGTDVTSTTGFENDENLKNGVAKVTISQKNDATNNENGKEAVLGTTSDLRHFAEVECKYDAAKIFNRVFVTDINTLLKMDSLWKTRPKPTPLTFDASLELGISQVTDFNPHQEWSLAQNMVAFAVSLANITKKYEAKKVVGQILTWDKDDNDSMTFVYAATNIRAHIFDIHQTLPFEIKSMAGRIITAIASTNAIVAAMAVVEAIKIVRDQKDQLRLCYLYDEPNGLGKFISNTELDPPMPTCRACAPVRRSSYVVNMDQMTLSELSKVVLIGSCSMHEPDVSNNLSGNIIISSEGDIPETFMAKTLSEANIKNGEVFDCSDFNQNYDFLLTLYHDEKLGPSEFLIGDGKGLKKEAESSAHRLENGDPAKPSRKRQFSTNDNEDSESKKPKIH
uniref:SUMO-activating enzyme subunit n=1 Tax=Rhabditophanes sp. KR3021 TaxID=114890 RepID=A0AC35TV08_9BILA